MTVDISTNGQSVTVTYIADNGGSASAVVIGESRESVEKRIDSLVSRHELADKALSEGSEGQ